MQLAAIRGMSPQNIISKVLDVTFDIIILDIIILDIIILDIIILDIIILGLRALFAHHLTVPLSASARWL